MTRQTSVERSQSIQIEPRNSHFDFDPSVAHDWHSGDPVKTLVFNGLSITFPPGERFFIRSVRRFQDVLDDPVLKKQVFAFVSQEAHHTREHVGLNDALEQNGMRARKLEKETFRLLELAEKRLSQKSQLAVTCALEHFTAILAHEILTNPELLAGARHDYRQIWLWHAVEEVEHKGVAFDVLTYVADRRMYARRCAAMLIVSLFFAYNLGCIYFALMRDAGRSGSFKAWLTLTNFLWGRPGLFRRVSGSWLSWFQPGFHPWDHDNRQDVQTASQWLYPSTPAAD